MWEECQTYDEWHFSGKLDKIENYLSNESFLEEMEQYVAAAPAIVYVEEVWLEEFERGNGLGLQALGVALKDANVPDQSVALLQPGSIGNSTTSDASQAGEKLAKHWGRLGFEEWSYTDPAWMCLLLCTESTGCI